MATGVAKRIEKASVFRLVEGKVTKATCAELFANRRVVLFGVPGAFTPTCHNSHLPGFIKHAADIKALGIEEIFCTSVNDAFVMDAWGSSLGANNITMLADGNGELAGEMDLIRDKSAFGLGQRSARFASVLNDGVAEFMEVDESALEATTAEKVMEYLESSSKL